jgi:acyl transferase domain-containing protein/NAD(P)H-dependent flavin oxidoreductase YrpB (nitropropane dioxygenase family)/NADP-dependent 3-hydroxy acid dehydrogenase YdfG
MTMNDILAYSTSAASTATLPIAACRAGALGIVNAELGIPLPDLRLALDILADPIKGARGDFGVKVPQLDHDLLKALADYVPLGLTHLIVDVAGLEKFITKLKTKLPDGLSLWVEITGRSVPKWLLKVDGIILKGNEAGGFVGEESAFILFQHWHALTDLPIVIRGGMTPHAAAGCRALGAAGVAFDSQLLLMPEAQTAAPIAALIAAMSGTETTTIGDPSAGNYFRLLQHPRCTAAKELIAGKGLSPNAEVRSAIASASFGWANPATDLLPLGQDAAFAKPYAETYGSVAGLFAAVRAAVADYPAIAAKAPPMAEGSPLAEALGTRLPIIQGPMTRVSDNADFAAAVAEGGALPMLALAVMRPAQVDTLLEETSKRLGDLPWGVGFLGFLPAETLNAQIDVALKHKPNYAIIAGGRPDQAVALEAQGIPAFLHVPSARLLGYFIENGARRFIFEGRECGGHIGPMSSFTLWSLMIDQILTEIDRQKVDPSDLQCVFAGGIHDAFSSAVLQVMLAPLIARGVRLGVIIGTAYVFTKEIVDTGAVLSGFQDAMVKIDDTVALTTGPGHASRCARTPFVDDFFAQQKALAADTTVPEDSKRETLDKLILGTLRAASKGQQRAADTGELQTLDVAEQYKSGMYMIGQVASLREDCLSIEELHGSVSFDATHLLETAANSIPAPSVVSAPKPYDIAIIGLSCALPGAMNASRFWSNIIGKTDSISEIPAHRWDWRLYFDEDRAKKDKIYSRWGGFLEDMPFDPMRYGITPKSLKSVDPMQLMGLSLADEALVDSGYEKMKPALSERTSVILGASGGSGDVGLQYNLRAEYPRFAGDLPESLSRELPDWSEDTFAGILINVLSGRVSNRLNLGGANFTTDAACASSLAALYQAANELSSGRSDMAIAGGVDTQQSPFGFMCFAQTGALSPTGRCQSFDTGADGIAISEGIVMFVLKRLEDAEAAGDRIYAVLKGIGAGSDGKAKALNAPEPKGQLRAMKRAYDQAGYTADTVRLFEAHGTGTVAGDTAELESTGLLVAEHDTSPRKSVIGSVKTNIGHTKATAGLAGLLKIVLSMHHRVLPPHRGVKNPNKVLADDNAALYLLNEAEPWIDEPGKPRRASVSAFGFGGTNFHATIEAYEGEYRPQYLERLPNIMPSELVVLDAVDVAGLVEKVANLSNAILNNATLELRDVAAAAIAEFDSGSPARASLVASDLPELLDQLADLHAHLTNGTDLAEIITLSTTPADPGKVAILFPGQGSQYPFMGREVAVWFREMSAAMTAADAQLAETLSSAYGKETTLSHFIYPRGAYTPSKQTDARKALTATDIAQPALGAVEAGLWDLMSSGFGIKGDMFAGHSYGEFTAHYGAGALDFKDLMTVSRARGQLIVEKAAASGGELGTMLAVQADRGAVEALIADIRGLVVANHNGPKQVIVSGTHAAIEAAEAAFVAQSINVQTIPVAAAFHSALMSPAKDALSDVVTGLDWRAPQGDVYSNQYAAPHAADPREAMVSHLISPVNFVDQITAMHDAGARTFVEVGPKAVLSKLVHGILSDKDYTTVPVDAGDGSGLSALLAALGKLAVLGVELDLTRLLRGRDCLDVTLAGLTDAQRGTPMSKHAWWVNGSTVWSQKEDRRVVGVTVDTVDTVPVQVAPAPATPPRIQAGNAPKSASAKPTQAPPAASRSSRISKSTTKTTFHERQPMFNREIRPEYQDQSSTVTNYFKLVAHSLEIARDVAMAEMGIAPEAPQEQRIALQSTDRNGHKRVPVRPAPSLAAVPAASPPPSAPAPEPSVVQSAHGAIVASLTPVPTAVAAPAPVPAAVAAPAPVPTAVAAPAPVPTAVAAPAPAPAADAVLSEDALRALLLATVSEKTGYDEDMVEFDQNLEADLGIDSIKRVDVVAGMMKALPSVYEQALGNEGRSKLSTSSTLQDMMDQLLAAGGASPNFNQAEVGTTLVSAGQAPVEAPLLRPDMTTRFIVESFPQPADAKLNRRLTTGVFLILPGPYAVTKSVAAALEGSGQSVELVPAAAMANEAELIAWCDTNTERLGMLAGIVHLTGLSAKAIDPAQTSPDDWTSEVFRNEKAIFLALKHLKLAAMGHAVSVSALGGHFGRDLKGSGPMTLAGGAVGLLKSFNRERELGEGVRARAIDLDPSQHIDEISYHIMDEMALLGGRIEVGYPSGARHIFKTADAALPETADVSRALPKVVLATGGARGITAETLRSVAGPDMVIVMTGRSPMPGVEEALRDDPALAALSTGQDLAKYFAKTEKMPLGDARRRASKVIAAREMIDNVADLTALGAQIEYVAVDVTDEKALPIALSKIVKAHGPIDTVVHGAGVIEDKYLADITSDSWDRVVRTKVIGLLLMLKHLDHDALKSLVIYSSVAGRFGNAGQTSYATGNELMNRLCCQMQARLGEDVIVRAMNWGPWGPTKFGAGMVTPETELKFRSQGVFLVTAQQGRNLFHHAVLSSNGNAGVEVICGAGPWEDAEAMRSKFAPASVGLLPEEAPVALTSDKLEQTLTLHDTAPFLADHMIDGTAVLPMAMALETMAQSVMRAFGTGWKLVAIEDAKLFNGLMMKTPSNEMIVRMVQKSHGMGETQTVAAKLFSASAPKRPHYAADFVLAPMMTAHETAGPLPKIPAKATAFNAEALYPEHLFHGPAFQSITSADGIWADGVRATIKTAAPDRLLGNAGGLDWLFDPLLVDAIAQLPLAWSSTQHNLQVLPLQFERIERFVEVLDANATKSLTLDMTITDHSPEAVVSDVRAIDPDGRVVMAVTGMRHAIRPSKTEKVVRAETIKGGAA